MDKFDLDYQFTLYLERVKLSGLKPETIQHRETKRAFMGACGQMLILFRDDITQLQEVEAIGKFNEMNRQVLTFFGNEIK